MAQFGQGVEYKRESRAEMRQKRDGEAALQDLIRHVPRHWVSHVSRIIWKAYDSTSSWAPTSEFLSRRGVGGAEILHF